jgi:DNA-directed RNA polymerase specialized sigma24 family protein
VFAVMVIMIALLSTSVAAGTAMGNARPDDMSVSPSHSGPDSNRETCWTMIRKAALGEPQALDAFGHAYLPVVRAYLGARWNGTSLGAEIDDAVQDVFLDCIGATGALSRAERRRDGGFRAFLHGVTRNIALRFETKQARRREDEPALRVDTDAVAARDRTLSRTFDRNWALAVVGAARKRWERTAAASGPEAVRRVELLRLRFEAQLPIRGIAERWKADAAVLHHEYSRARKEFKAALEQEVAFHHPGAREEIERECAELLALLS